MYAFVTVRALQNTSNCSAVLSESAFSVHTGYVFFEECTHLHIVRSWEGEKNTIDSSKMEGVRKRKGRDNWEWELDRRKVSICIFFSVFLVQLISNNYTQRHTAIPSICRSCFSMTI